MSLADMTISSSIVYDYIEAILNSHGPKIFFA